MASVDAPKVPTAGEQIESSVDAYLRNEGALRNAARKDTQQAFDLSRLGLLGDNGSGGNNYADIMRDLAPIMDEVTAGSNTRQREADLRDVMGDNYDPNKSMAENIAAVDRTANPEMYAAIENLGGINAPKMADTNWADEAAYARANRDDLSTTAWNRFDRNADKLRDQPIPQLNQDLGTKELQDKNWATDVINDQVWNAKGVNMATGDKNQIFNYSPEADRAREIIGGRLSDGGGENLAYAYGHAQNLRKTATGADRETGMRDSLLSNLGNAGKGIGAQQVGLQIDNEGLMTDLQRKALQEDSRSAFQARGRVRDDSAIMAEMADLDKFRAMRRAENNTNFMNQANVGLQNAQNNLQAQIAGGQQGLQGLGMQGNVISDRFRDRMGADDSYNRRMLESIGAMSNTDAQRFGNFQAGVSANMGFDQDYQNRVDRYLDAEMKQGQYNTDQTNTWLNQLEGVNNRYQDVERYNNDLRAENARFGNDAMIGQDALRGGRMDEYMRGSEDWNRRMMIDDAAQRQRMGDHMAISQDWRNRQQQDYGNEYGQAMAQLGAWQGVRQDPWASLTNRNSPNINTNANAWGQGNPQAQAGNVGFGGVWNLNNSLTNMDINAQNQANAANANILGGMMGGFGGMMGGWAQGGFGSPWW